MKPAALWKRLPIIRHVRYYVTMYRINRHYDMWASMGAIPWGAGEDYKIADRIWKGEL